MFKAFIFLLLGLIPSLFCAEKEGSVVCIHGFLGAPWNMRFLEKNLEKDGWEVVNWKYPSRDRFIAEHGKQLVQDLIEIAEKKPGQPIHFVTHSMGSLVLLAALNHPQCPKEAKIGKVVLIAPPIQGSHFGRWLGKFSPARWMAKGFSGNELMTKSSFDDLGNYPASLQDILVIAGTLGFNPMLNGVNDGTVALQETTLPVPHKRVTIKRGHKTIVFSKRVYDLTRDFLEKQRSEKEPSNGAT